MPQKCLSQQRPASGKAYPSKGLSQQSPAVSQVCLSNSDFFLSWIKYLDIGNTMLCQRRSHDKMQRTCIPDQWSSVRHQSAPVWLQQMHHVQAGLLALVVDLRQATNVIQQSIAMWKLIIAWKGDLQPVCMTVCLRAQLPCPCMDVWAGVRDSQDQTSDFPCEEQTLITHDLPSAPDVSLICMSVAF